MIYLSIIKYKKKGIVQGKPQFIEYDETTGDVNEFIKSLKGIYMVRIIKTRTEFEAEKKSIYILNN